ncbi:MAG: DUF1499 domain-containing protein [Pseudomonadota bacterium]
MKWSNLALLVAVIALILLLIGGPGTRLGWWGFGTGFGLMRYASYAGFAGAALVLIFLVVPATRKDSIAMLGLALVACVIAAAFPMQLRETVRSLPFIHDISTDTVNPPLFVAILPLRADAPNPPEYAGPEVAAQQLEAYPDIQTRTIELSPSALFDIAVRTAESQGWHLIDSNLEEGRIEAVATTLWYGFKDDVVIRIVPDGMGSQLDIRSKSRVGGSDIGANANRIRAFLGDLDQALD